MTDRPGTPKDDGKVRDREPARVSLHPLHPLDALKALLRTPPPERGKGR